MPIDLKVVTVKLSKADLRRMPTGETRSEFNRAAVSERLAKLDRPAWRPTTALGRKLARLRQRYLRAGGELLDAQGISEEVRARRGGLA